MEPFRKIFRFLKNPKPYFSNFGYKFFKQDVVIRFYRSMVLPYLTKRVAKKKRINVVFLAMNPDMWKYDGVYRRFEADKRFNPVVVTAMRNIPDMSQRIKEQEIMYEYFSSRGYNIVKGYDVEKHRWIRLKSLRPDIIFYTQPYNTVIQRQFEYCNNLRSLHCYSPYSFQFSNVNWNWNNDLQQYCWKVFYVGATHLEQCARISRIGNINAVASGYSFEEEYAESLNDHHSADNAWRNDKRKRIIWAPHHSINKNELFKVSSFLDISDLMLQIREQYKNRIIFAFKPHPVLKTKLYAIWGQERTDSYYRDWAKSENSFDAQGDYHALFAGSDAMIHCSGSFIAEYLYTEKPVSYVYGRQRNPPDLGIIGDAALNAHYPLYNEKDIRLFLDDVILRGNDTMSDRRREVVEKHLKSPNGKMFSENVYNSIVEGLELQCQNLYVIRP